MKHRLSRGFTLLEVLVVVAIIGILISIGTAAYTSAQKKSRDSRRQGDLRSIQNAFEQYYAYEQNQKSINESKFDLVLMSKRKPIYDQLEQLRVAKQWEKLYEDENAAVFRRKK